MKTLEGKQDKVEVEAILAIMQSGKKYNMYGNNEVCNVSQGRKLNTFRTVNYYKAEIINEINTYPDSLIEALKEVIYIHGYVEFHKSKLNDSERNIIKNRFPNATLDQQYKLYSMVDDLKTYVTL